jgi:hypothetical protein
MNIIKIERCFKEILHILNKRNVGIHTKEQVKEAMDELFNPKPITFSFISDEDKMRDFELLTKQKFLKEYPYISEESYIITEGDLK